MLLEADGLAKQSRLSRFIHSGQVTEKIANMTKKIDDARQNFQVRSYTQTPTYMTAMFTPVHT